MQVNTHLHDIYKKLNEERFIMRRLHLLLVMALIGSMFIFSMPTKSNAAADWHEVQFQYVYGTEYAQMGESINPADGTARDDTTAMSTFTLEYNNGWTYGETYLLVDIYLEENSDEVSYYTQGWEYFSLNAIFDTEIFTMGPILDLRIAPGWQLQNIDDYYAGDAAQAELDGAWGAGKPVYGASDLIELFYGINIALDITGFDYMGLTLGVYDDFNSETDFDMQAFVSWYYRATFDLGPTSWKVEGFLNYLGDRDSGVSSALDQQANIFSKHQILLDAGKLFWDKPNQFFIGTEIQWTRNVYGIKDVPDGYGGYVTKEQDEFFPAILVEWVF